MEYKRNFPHIRDELAPSVLRQAWKVEEEAREALEMAENFVTMGETPMRAIQIIEETLDTIQACETLLHVMVREGYATNEKVDLIYKSVIQKNRRRGYYEKEG